MSHIPIFWILAAAVAAPLLAEIPLGFKVPVIVLEVLLGSVIGPHGMGFVQFDSFVATMFMIGMAATLFMAGMELDIVAIKGRPLMLASVGWATSVVLGVAAVGLLHVIPQVRAPWMVALALCTTSLGVLIPVLRDGELIGMPIGRFVVAAGTVGEVAPIVAVSLLLSQKYSTWQEAGFLAAFLGIVGTAIAIGLGLRPPRLLALLERNMHRSAQLPVRIALLIPASLFLLAQSFGFESLFGAFAAGMILGQVARGASAKTLHEKLEAVSFAWFYPFFFVGTGIKFDVATLGQDTTTMLLVPAFALLFLLVRGAPVFFYRGLMAKGQRVAFALCSAVPSLSIVVVITEIGARTQTVTPDVCAALVGAALLSVLLFPTSAGILLARPAGSPSGVPGPITKELP
jgi:Kef-type K+ transport system membrane component KefB